MSQTKKWRAFTFVDRNGNTRSLMRLVSPGEGANFAIKLSRVPDGETRGSLGSAGVDAVGS